MEITGRVTKDAETKRTKSGAEVVEFSIVINDRYKTKDGEKKEVATYIKCAYWLNSKIKDHLKKGGIVTVTGHLGLNSYKGSDGEFYAHITFHVNSLQLLSGGKKISADTIAATPVEGTSDDLPF